LQDDQQNGKPQQQLNGELQLSGAANQLHLRMQLQHDLLQQRGSMQWHLDDLALNWDKLNLPEMTALTKLEFLNGHWPDKAGLTGNKPLTPGRSNPT